MLLMLSAELNTHIVRDLCQGHQFEASYLHPPRQQRHDVTNIGPEIETLSC